MSIYDVARRASGVSELTAGKTKVGTKDIVSKYPDGVTIAAMDLFGTGEDQYAVLNIAEDENIYFFGGQALTGLAQELVGSFGSIDAVNAELKKEPLKVKLTLTKTKGNKDFTSFEVV